MTTTLDRHEVAEIYGLLDTLADEVAAVKSRLGRVERDVKDLKTDVSELKTDVSELKSDMALIKNILLKHFGENT